ncbi:AraC family transcriptional regulator [Aurantimonas sp. 22II-16-19i]|uniref:helix-turn-helix domain-containing protein n=1 Tax=Aurantimonas sp. 22II-16-19i TaxID=1317114 RepID=UPI0009F7EFB1|nr:AraC family transcriptional regulator [Aurantimonas sp. 22II-16-19i]ORE90367.1 AraC family transcriptional regulator [Aurantimonas sp. 22II-16-19i]
MKVESRDTSACGSEMARHFGSARFQSIRTTSLRTAQVSVTRLSAHAGQIGMTAPIPLEKAWIVTHLVADLQHHELWKHGRMRRAGGLAKGSMYLLHLEEEPRAYIPHAYDSMQFHIPDLALRELAESEGYPLFDGATDGHQPGTPVFAALCRSILPALARPTEASLLFIDHVVTAVCAHLIARHCRGWRAPANAGSLSVTQERQAKELLAADLAASPNLVDVAATCGMPTVTFSRAFHRTTGVAPYQWLKQQRLSAASRLLVCTDRAIADIASCCGFADQAHLTRAFKDAFGTTPASFRRARRS